MVDVDNVHETERQSRFAQIDSSDIENFIQGQKNGHTVIQIEGHIKVFRFFI